MFTRQWHAALVALVLAGSWALWAPHAVVGQEALAGSAAVPQAVTTEGAEYCAHLQQKYAQIEHADPTPAAPDAASLSLEGARMCGHGDTRAGILRLRRALVLIMNPGGRSGRQ